MYPTNTSNDTSSSMMQFSTFSNSNSNSSNNNDDDIVMMDDIMGCRGLLVDEEELFATSNQEASMVFEQWLSDTNAKTNDAANPHSTSISSSSSSSFNDHSDTTSASLHSDDDLALMEIDKQIGSTLLSDDVFGSGGSGGVDDAFENFCIPPLASATNLNDDLDLDLDIDSSDETADTTTTGSTLLPTLVEFIFESHHDIDDLFLQDPLPASTLVTPPSAPPSPLTDDVRYQQVLKKLEASMRRSRETRKSLVMKTNKTVKYGRKKSV
eukprot:CAMPEP_0113512250 /NCGR_PEP_ID=MMETSP0014_2-20120614/39238_1 /TAXON_ID=2857 /ORGANISM="Nitzschia sp." /LENGTH=267 /DNA_ID=CAMNT_0000408593 /DNA_START=303 /DNA_END=1102 /DNA_ORIENTATION=+ /assembly_acc=CAM_ASM_000159